MCRRVEQSNIWSKWLESTGLLSCYAVNDLPIPPYFSFFFSQEN